MRPAAASVEVAESSSAASQDTALSVSHAFHRALKTGYASLFSAQEIALAGHMTQIHSFSVTGALIQCSSWLSYSMQKSFFNRLIIPCHDELIMLRKLIIRHKIEEAVANGTQQIVFLGGGYDIRALVTACNYPNVAVYELDCGAVRQNKLDCIRTIPREMLPFTTEKNSPEVTQINHNLLYLDCDLSEQSMEEMLISHGFQPQQQCLIIAEDVIMQNKKKLMTTIHSLFQHPESELLIKFIGKSTERKQTQQEECRTALSSNGILSFAADYQLSIVAKKAPAQMLSAIGMSDAAAFFRQSEMLQEFYFCMQSDVVGKQYGSLQAVPEMDIPVEALTVAESVSGCALM